MPLQPGEHLGPFEITAFIGAGGMGEVYRARDTRLGRTVALKILSSEIANKPDLRERFEREAQTISALNHPSICTLHDVGRHENVAYLVMEFLEGESLAGRLDRGPVPLKEALAIAAQIGEGLEAAHRQGIVHRDLKPGNIMLVKADGAARSATQAKLLDFGLAKLRGAPDNTPVVVSAARTDVGSLTAVGAVLGTLQYMSPEQLEGKDADARSDIFALGTVLYEMLTGRKAFEGKSQVSLMAAILEQDPQPVSAVLPLSPRSLDYLVRGCLAKDRAERWQNAADVVKQIKWIADEVAAPAEPDRARRGHTLRERAIWATALIVLAGALVTVALRQRLTPATPAAIVRFEIPPPVGSVLPGANSTPRMAVSPDGRYVVFTVNRRDGKPDQLWIRRLDSLQSTPLVTITETIGEPVQQPFWSPDGREVGFFIDGKMKKVTVAGGVVQTLCSVPGNNFGGTWNADGTILFGSSLTAGLQRVSASGGVPSQVTRLDAQSKESSHLWPRFLPDGRHFLYQAQQSTGGDRTIYVGTLDGPDRTRLFTSLYMVDFAPPDRLLFLREGALLAQRFDAAAMRLQGEPIALAEGVQASLANGRAAFSVSATGVLIYRPGESSTAADSQLAWLDRAGKEVGVVGVPSGYRGLDISPDGGRAVVHKEDPNGTGDLWVIDLVRGPTSRLTFDPEHHNMAPVWSPDGRRIVFSKNNGPSWAIYDKDASGVGEDHLLYESKGSAVVPWSVSPDGTTLVFAQVNPDTGYDLYTLALMDGAKPALYFRAPGMQGYAQFSPDGHWLAYGSFESGNAEVYVRSFPKPDSRYQLSTNGGSQPRWRRDGRQLIYKPPGTGGPVSLMAVDVESTQGGLQFGMPTRLFEASLPTLAHLVPYFSLGVTPDAQRLLVSRAPGEGGESAFETPLAVVLNWDAALPR